MRPHSFTVVVPAYNRPIELVELLDSVLGQTSMPHEVLVCEDNSPQRDEVRQVCEKYYAKLADVGVNLRYVENETNLGYDKNLRKCIEFSSSDWAVILGNDDVLLPNAIDDLNSFVSRNDVDFISRSFVRFSRHIDNTLGVSSISGEDTVFDHLNSRPRMIFRAAGFVGGLVIRTDFARRHSTSEFDGSLYYQIYLAAIAYCGRGIGYVATPIVGGRADNPPMFGTADDDRGVHVPGSYTAKGRAKMWQGAMDIASKVGAVNGVDLLSDMRNELEVRQSFHVFEMNAGASREELRSLRLALTELGLFSHPVPRFFYCLDYMLGKRARYFYAACRKVMQ